MYDWLHVGSMTKRTQDTWQNEPGPASSQISVFALASSGESTSYLRGVHFAWGFSGGHHSAGIEVHHHICREFLIKRLAVFVPVEHHPYIAPSTKPFGLKVRESGTTESAQPDSMQGSGFSPLGGRWKGSKNLNFSRSVGIPTTKPQ